jgi:sugar lactone lactonase YvrE
VPVAERLTDAVANHGEGPVWSTSWGGLRWVDMLAGDVLSLAADGSVHRKHVGDVAAAVRPRTQGGYVVAVERGFALDDGDGSPMRVLPDLWVDSGLRMNEGGCDSDGRFYCGSMAYDAAPGRGSLFRLDPDGVVTEVLTGCTVSNGLEWSPDGRTAYYVDSATHRIDAFDYDYESGLTGRRPVVDIPPAHGSPDGLTVDAEGGIWVAMWGGGSVLRYSPDGELDEVVELPVNQVTACTFGGDNLDELFITTSAYDLPEGAEPAAGSVFCLSPGVRGLAVREFAG